MAKRRFRQNQSARLYYKEKDHREIVYDNNYINGILIGKTSNRMDWRQYKHKLLFGTMYGRKRSSDSEDWHPVALDVENKYLSFPSNYYYSSSTFGYAILESSDSFMIASTVATTSGHDWYTVTYDVDISQLRGGGNELHTGGDDLYVYIARDGDLANTQCIHFYEFIPFGHKEEYGGFSEYSHLMQFKNSVFLNPYLATRAYEVAPVFQGKSKDGVFVNYIKPRQSTTEAYQEKLYNITPDGAQLIHTFDAEGSSNVSNQVTFCTGRILHNNGKYCILHSYVTTTTPKMQGVYIYWANDITPTQWNQTIIIPQENLLGNGIDASLYFRNNTWYLYCREAVTVSRTTKIRFSLYKSTNLSSWQSVNLPTYLDVPIIEDDQTHGDIRTCDLYDKLRLVFNSIDNTIPTTDRVFNTNFVSPSSQSFNSRINYQMDGQFGLMFVDGKPDQERPFEYVFGGTTYTDSQTRYSRWLWWYIDNMECEDSENNFAFSPSQLLVHSRGEVVQDDDYVFGRSETIIESEV